MCTHTLSVFSQSYLLMVIFGFKLISLRCENVCRVIDVPTNLHTYSTNLTHIRRWEIFRQI